MKRDSLAKFIYYSVPADCEVPTHSKTDRTAFFYQKVSKGRKPITSPSPDCRAARRFTIR